MDNASKNATDMIDTLQMQYNRGRQASITNELVDIITGAYLPIPAQRHTLKTGLLQVQVPSKRDRWSCACDRIVEVCVRVLYLPAAYGPLHLIASNWEHEASVQAMPGPSPYIPGAGLYIVSVYGQRHEVKSWIRLKIEHILV